jgi:hypothetical protein
MHMRNPSHAPELKDLVVTLKPQRVPPRAPNIAECSIVTNSVVATATIRLDGTMRRIIANWGDGTVNTLRYRPGLDAMVGQDNQLPPGTYKLSHAYAAPEDRKPFDHVVLIRVEDASGGVDFCLQQITLTPRYRVIQYRTRLNLESRCDSSFESQSEFDITLYVDQDAIATWRWEPGESVIPSAEFVLEGSLVSRELTVADGTISLHFDIIERDPFFDDHVDIWTTLSANDVSERVSRETEGDGCTIRYSYDREVTLLVPLPSYGQTIVFQAA